MLNIEDILKVTLTLLFGVVIGLMISGTGVSESRMYREYEKIKNICSSRVYFVIDDKEESLKFQCGGGNAN